MSGQPVTLVGQGRSKHSFVSIADVAAYAVAAVENPAARNQRLAIGGPEPLSWRDVIDTVQQVLGRDIPVRTVPIGERVPGLPETVQVAISGTGFASLDSERVPGLPETVQGLMIGLEMSESAVDMVETSRVFGIRPTPLLEFVQRAFAR